MTQESVTSDLRSKVVRGVGWKAASTVSVQVTRMIVAIILARLLTPREFGIAAALLVFSGMAMILTDLALGAALVQRAKITELDRSTIFWTSVTLGVVLMGACAASAGLIASFYGEATMTPMVVVFSATFLLSGLSATQGALMTRDLAFRALEVRMIVATLAGAVVGVTIAVLGYGAWAIIWQALTTTAISTVLLWVYSSWRPHFMFSFTNLRDLGASGLRMFGSQFAFFLNKNTDNVLIARFLGATSLGAYAIAYNLILFPVTRIAGPIRSVLFPAMSRVQDQRERLIKGWLTGNRLIAAIAVPAMLGMVVVAPDFVPVVLGDQWDSATPVLQILAVVGLVQALQIICGSALNAIGEFSAVLRFTVASYIVNVGAFAAGLHWGIVGVATAYAIATVALFPVFIWLTASRLGSTVGTYARSLWGVTQAGVGMLAVVWALRMLLVSAGIPAGLRLVALIVAGAVVYLGLLKLRSPELIREARGLRSRRGGGLRPA